ncbi:MAG: serine/threonine protein kinase [Planctomycetes bacterium]|nr:serine/threonine protein kinase [Planctomycetota bacterium]MCB9884671.1 serine/threonine protein kinase [Planctomycetota bacterium]
MPASDSSRPRADRTESLLEGVVTLADAEQAAALEQLCREHPEMAAALRDRYALFLRIAAPPAADTAAGRQPRHFGEYTLLRELGRGGMGVVYLASQKRGEQTRMVALKLVRDRLALSPQARERLLREGAAAFRLEHPGICQAYDLGEIDGTPYVSMRYVPGRTLAQLLADARAAHRLVELASGSRDAGSHSSSSPTGSGRVHDALLLIEQVARALHFAHEAGFVHRDVKPGNIMVGDDGAPVLLDFGLVHDQASSHGLTMTDQPLGTPNYMSPEQIAPRGRKADRTTDIYSLGVTLYEVLAGELPFHGANREELFRQILDSTPPRLSQRAPGISRDVEVVVRTALDKDPDRRYRTALAFAEDLRRARLAQPIVARPPNVGRRLLLWSRRNPLGAVMITLLAISQVVIVFLALAAEERAAEALAAKQLAEDNYHEASDAIDQLATVATEQLADVPWLVPVRSALFEKVLAFHARTAARSSPEPAEQQRAARAWVQSAHLHEDLGHNQEAERLLDKALPVLAADGAAPENLRWLVSAQVLLANLAQKRGDPRAAETHLRDAIGTCEALVAQGAAGLEDRLRLATSHYELGELLSEVVGRRDEAAAAVESCLRIVGAIPGTEARIDEATALRLRARMARHEGRELESLADLERGVAMLRELVQAQPHDRSARANLATSLISQGLALKDLRKAPEALAHYDEARQVYESLIASFPFHLHYRINLGRTYNNIAVLQRATGNGEGSRTSMLHALELSREALRLEPQSTFAKTLLTDCAYNLANQTRGEDPAGAEALYRECLGHLGDVLEHNADALPSLEMACRARTSLGALCATQQRFAEALAEFQQARVITERLFAAQPPTPRLLRNAAILNYNTGSLLVETDADLPGAIECLRTAVRYGEQALSSSPQDPRAVALVLGHQVRLATFAEMLDPASAANEWQAAHQLVGGAAATLQRRLEADEGSRFDIVCAARGLAACQLRGGDLEAAAASVQRATQLFEAGRSVGAEVEQLLIAHLRLSLAANTQDATGAAAAAADVAASARRLLPRLAESPLQRQRVRALGPQVLQQLREHGDAAQIDAVQDLVRAAAD